MDNHINVLKEIGSEEEGLVSLDYVKNQYNPNAKRVIVHISSYGGDVDEGLAIRDFLNSIPQEVHTIGEGMVASIATMIFLSGKTRELKPNAQFLAHLPSLSNFSGTSDDYERAAKYMIDIRSRIAEIYAMYSGKPVEEMEDFMRKDTPIFAQEAKKMGFATHVEEFRAVAKLNKNNIDMSQNSEADKPATKLDEIANKITSFFDSIKNEVEEPLTDVVEEADTEVQVDTKTEDNSDLVIELKESNKALKEELEALRIKVNEDELEKEKTDEKLAGIENQLSEIMSMTIGGKPKVANGVIKKEGKNNKQGHKLDGFASKFRK